MECVIFHNRVVAIKQNSFVKGKVFFKTAG